MPFKHYFRNIEKDRASKKSNIKRNINWRSKLVLSYLGFSAIWVLNCLTIMRSYWSGDDWPNSQTPYWIQWRYGEITNWNIWTEAMFWNHQWMYGAGRFYPIHWIESRFVFSYFRELWQYKTYQTVTLVLAGLIFILVVYNISGSHIITIGTLATLSITVQFRRDFDPHLAFASMLPTLIIRVFVAGYFAYLAGKTHNNLFAMLCSISSGISFFLGMSTYEFGFLLFPVLLVCFLSGSEESNPIKEIGRFRTKWLRRFLNIRLTPIIFSWLAYGAFVFGYLRPNADSISGAYVLGISWKSIPVVFSQALMGLPGIALRNIDFHFEVKWLIFCLFVALISRKSIAKLLEYYASRSGREKIIKLIEKKSLFSDTLLIILALNLIFAPGIMMSLQKTWWDRADLSHSYLGVMITEFGTALVTAIIFNRLILQKFKPHQSKGKRLK